MPINPPCKLFLTIYMTEDDSWVAGIGIIRTPADTTT